MNQDRKLRKRSLFKSLNRFFKPKYFYGYFEWIVDSLGIR